MCVHKYYVHICSVSYACVCENGAKTQGPVGSFRRSFQTNMSMAMTTTSLSQTDRTFQVGEIS